MAVYAGNLKPWRVSAQDFPVQGPAQQRLMFLLRYAVLAPSLYNAQPWRFSVHADCIEIFADESRCLPHIDSDNRGLHISLGCALENLIIAAEHFEFGWQLSLSNNGHSPAAIVRLLPGCPMEHGRDSALFDVIASRRTWTGKFEKKNIENDDIAWLREFCLEPGIDLHAVPDSTAKAAIGELGTQADAIQFARNEYREEARVWSAAVSGQGFARRLLTRAMSRLTAGPDGHAAFTGHSLGFSLGYEPGYAPGLILMAAADRSTASRLLCGQAYQRMSLAATNLGIAFQPIDTPMQVETLRPALISLVPGCREPLLLFRVGYMPGHATGRAKPKPRLAVESVASICE